LRTRVEFKEAIKASVKTNEEARKLRGNKEKSMIFEKDDDDDDESNTDPMLDPRLNESATDGNADPAAKGSEFDSD
jgi:hypothetical protein